MCSAAHLQAISESVMWWLSVCKLLNKLLVWSKFINGSRHVMTALPTHWTRFFFFFCSSSHTIPDVQLIPILSINPTDSTAQHSQSGVQVGMHFSSVGHCIYSRPPHHSIIMLLISSPILSAFPLPWHPTDTWQYYVAGGIVPPACRWRKVVYLNTPEYTRAPAVGTIIMLINSGVGVLDFRYVNL